MPFDFEKGKLSKRLRKGFRWGKRQGLHKSCRHSAGCRCPNCRLKVSDHPEIPCFERKCPRCGTPMARLFITN